jgi:hypothetical protein
MNAKDRDELKVLTEKAQKEIEKSIAKGSGGK